MVGVSIFCAIELLLPVHAFLGNNFLESSCFDASDKLTTVTLEKDQESVFARFAPKCTAKELRTLIRLIKHDLRMNAGAKPVLDALDPRAYEAFQTSRDLSDVVKRVNQREGGSGTTGAKLSKQLR